VKAEPSGIGTETADTTVPAARIIGQGRGARGESDAGRYGVDLDRDRARDGHAVLSGGSAPGLHAIVGRCQSACEH
jgi:hypothetical protein